MRHTQVTTLSFVIGTDIPAELAEVNFQMKDQVTK